MDPPLPRQESSGALPKIADVQPADMERYIKPIMKAMYAKFKNAVQEHMALVKSQYETGLRTIISLSAKSAGRARPGHRGQTSNLCRSKF
eukprot:COSAG01_NODE_2125_length_8369_cov_17.028174_3_plen_90_part_00